MIQFLERNIIARVILLFVRLYLGFGWLMSGVHKYSAGFDASGFLKGVTKHPIMSLDGKVQYPNFNAFLEHIVLPQADIINILIPALEVSFGVLLIIGLFTPIAAFGSLVLNFLFLFAGALAVNPLYILLGLIIFLGGYNSGAFGIDYFVKKIFNNVFFRIFNYRPEQVNH